MKTLQGKAKCSCMDLVLWGDFLKMACELNPNIPAVPPERPSLNFAVFLHIVMAFHLDSDECVNAISKVRKDETDQLIFLHCVFV